MSFDFLFAKPSFIGGMARLLDFGGTLNVYNVSSSEDLADRRALRQDWGTVNTFLASSMESMIDEYVAALEYGQEETT